MMYGEDNDKIGLDQKVYCVWKNGEVCNTHLFVSYGMGGGQAPDFSDSYLQLVAKLLG
jgi:hypothetical protein